MAVRHAETPELAQEVLLDAVLLIFKAQVRSSSVQAGKHWDSATLVTNALLDAL